MISYVPCEIVHERAQKLLSERHPIWRTRRQPVSVELLYVPHYLFEAQFDRAGERREYLAVDAVAGHFAYFRGQNFQRQPDYPSDQISFRLDCDEARERGLRSYQRALLQAGLKSGQRFEVTALHLKRQIYIPFWVGYFEHRGRIRLSIIDAIRGQRQGPQIRQLVVQGFRTT